MLKKIKYIIKKENEDIIRINFITYLNNLCSKNNIDFNNYIKYFIDNWKDNIDIHKNFTCNISLETMSDPVVVSSGYSYEKYMIEDYMKKQHNNEILDPTNKAILNKNIIIQNKNLKSVIKYYLNNNPILYDSLNDLNWRNYELLIPDNI